jgi:hypothetical protein
MSRRCAYWHACMHTYIHTHTHTHISIPSHPSTKRSLSGKHPPARQLGIKTHAAPTLLPPLHATNSERQHPSEEAAALVSDAAQTCERLLETFCKQNNKEGQDPNLPMDFEQASHNDEFVFKQIRIELANHDDE